MLFVTNAYVCMCVCLLLPPHKMCCLSLVSHIQTHHLHFIINRKRMKLTILFTKHIHNKFTNAARKNLNHCALHERHRTQHDNRNKHWKCYTLTKKTWRENRVCVCVCVSTTLMCLIIINEESFNAGATKKTFTYAHDVTHCTITHRDIRVQQVHINMYSATHTDRCSCCLKKKNT